MTQQLDAVSNMITYTLVRDKQSLVNLLERNGVRMPNNPSDREVTIAVLSASSKSPNFKNELAGLLTSKAVEIKSEYQSFAGDDSDFGFTGIDEFVGVINVDAKIANAAIAAKKNPKQTRQIRRDTRRTKQGGTVFGNFLRGVGSSATSQDTINAGINIGLTALNNKVAGKQNELQAQAAAITAQQDEARQAIAAQSGKGSNLILIVGVVVVVGILAYFAFKKK